MASSTKESKPKPETKRKYDKLFDEIFKSQPPIGNSNDAYKHRLAVKPQLEAWLADPTTPTYFKIRAHLFLAMRLGDVLLSTEDMPDIKAHVEAAAEEWQRIKADYLNDPAWAKEVKGVVETYQAIKFKNDVSEKIHKRQDGCCNPKHTGGQGADAGGV